ncbi:MAG: sensor histidine kinase [Acidobacteriota bacterium]
MRQEQQEIIVSLALYILAQRDEIITRWSEAVRQDPEIKSSDTITYRQLIQYMPKLFDGLYSRLQNYDQGVSATAERASRIHGFHRWQQGYNLSDLLREFSRLRTILLEYLTAFEQEHTDLTPPIDLAARKIVSEFLDEMALASVQQFVEERDNEEQRYRENLEKANRDLLAEITERKRLEELSRQKAEEAEQANRAKDQFLAVVSHELRSPLNALLGWARLLRSGKLDEADVERALETIDRNVKAQEKLINDLLDIGRIITGKLKIDFQSVELVSIIEASLETVRLMVQEKNIRLESILDSSVGPVSGDPSRLQQVILNLLNNAIKFTPSGGQITVQLSCSSTHAIISVSDTGKGISAEFLPYVFDRLRQVESANKEEQDGLGLGLAIVHHIVYLHGGTISAESKGEGQGARFTVTLPLLFG